MRYATFYYDLIKENISDLKIHENKEEALAYFNSQCHRLFELNTTYPELRKLRVKIRPVFKATKLPAAYGYSFHKYYGVSARTFRKMFGISIDEAMRKVRE